MERNNKLPKIIHFKNTEHFHYHKTELLKALFPKAKIIDQRKIEFQDSKFSGIIADVTSNAIYLEVDPEFRKKHEWLRHNHRIRLELVNTPLQYTASSGKAYLYPFDRDMYEDSKLGMEQKAEHFVTVLLVCLNYITN